MPRKPPRKIIKRNAKAVKAATKRRAAPPPPPKEEPKPPPPAGGSDHERALQSLAAVFDFDNLPLLGNPGTKQMKRRFLECMVRAMCILTTACASAGVTKTTIVLWRKEDEVFHKAYDELNEVALDFVEGKLFNLIQQGDRGAILFYLRTKGRSRGYVEQQRIPWIDPDGDGDDVFGSRGGPAGMGFIALEELQREVPPDSLDKALRIVDVEYTVEGNDTEKKT